MECVQFIRIIPIPIACRDKTKRINLDFLLFQLVALFPEGSRPGWSMDVVVPSTLVSTAQIQEISHGWNLLIEPVAQDAPGRPQSTDLHTFRPPPLFSMEDGESRPSNLAFGSLPYGSSFHISLSFQFQTVRLPQIRLTSNLAISIRVPARMEAPRRSSKMDNWQPLSLKIAPVHVGPFVVIIASVGCFDLGDVPLDADQSDSCG